MKALKLVILGILAFFAVETHAQISVHVNTGTPPMWAPIGYSEAKYYYLPDVEAYYDVPSSNFIYYNGINWVHRPTLPGKYKTYDLYHGYKVVMTDYHGKTPYKQFHEHKIKYAKGYRGQAQKTYGQRPEYKKSNGQGPYKGNSRNHEKQGKESHSDHDNKGKKDDHGKGHGKNK